MQLTLSMIRVSIFQYIILFLKIRNTQHLEILPYQKSSLPVHSNVWTTEGYSYINAFFLLTYQKLNAFTSRESF